MGKESKYTNLREKVTIIIIIIIIIVVVVVAIIIITNIVIIIIITFFFSFVFLLFLPSFVESTENGRVTMFHFPVFFLKVNRHSIYFQFSFFSIFFSIVVLSDF